jgi:hypothetical protein
MASDSKSGSPSDLRARTLELSGRVKAIAKELTATATKAAKASTGPASVRDSLRRIADKSSDFAALSVEVEKLRADWDHEASVGFLQLEARLKEICERNRWRLDGQWPDFIVELGIDLRIDEARRVPVVDGRPLASLDEVERELKAFVPQLLPKTFSPQTFRGNLLAAYDEIAGAEDSQVPLLSLYRQMVIRQQTTRFWRDAKASSFSPLTLSQFRARLSRMLEAGATRSLDRRELVLFPPIDARDSIFVYQPAERRFGFVGRVAFSKVEK